MTSSVDSTNEEELASVEFTTVKTSQRIPHAGLSMTSWIIDRDDSTAGWGYALLCGTLLRCYIQRATNTGYWVRFDSDAPFRHVEKVGIEMDTLEAIIQEKGNGFPEAGDLVPGTDGGLYRVVSTEGDIQTGRVPGASNWIRAKLEPADWDEAPSDDDVFTALASV